MDVWMPSDVNKKNRSGLTGFATHSLKLLPALSFTDEATTLELQINVFNRYCL